MNIKRTTLYILTLFIVIDGLSACDPRYGFVESEFKLAEESRLPKWLKLPKSHRRDSVDVVLVFYTMEKAKVNIIEKSSGDKIGNTITASLRWTEESKKKGFAVKPSYFVLTVDGVEELFEQRALEPKVYVSDKVIK